MKLSIIIVNYNTQKLLENCLNSVKKYLSIQDYEVIVVDNNSKSFSRASLKKIFSDIHIISSKENLGFGRANNLASKQARGEYIWFLNSDTELIEKNNIEALITFLDNNKNYAAVSPLVINEHGKPQASQYGYFPSIWKMVLNKLAKSRVENNPKRSRHWAWVDADYLPIESRDIDWVSGAAMMVRKKMFDDVGGFAKEYFLYYEDIDLCQKFKANRYKVRFVREAQVKHLEGGSNSNLENRKQIAYDGQDIYFQRWGSWLSRFFLRTLRKPYAKKWQTEN